MRTIGGILVLLFALGGCFDTPKANISFRCGPSQACPDNYECRDDGCCHLIGSPTSEICAPADASPNDTAVPDAVPDAAPDAMADAAVDAMPDAAVDAMPDAAVDAMPDAAVDAMPDAAVDAMPDAA